MATLALTVGSLYAGAGGFTSAFVMGGLSMLYGSTQEIKGQQLKDRNPPESRLGNPIPKPFGTVPLTGQYIWALEIAEEEDSSGGKGGPKITEYKYSVTFGAMFGVGPLEGIKELRFNENVIWSYNGGEEQGKKHIMGTKQGGTYWNKDASTGTWTSKSGRLRLRLGTQTQMPDADEEADKGAGNVPAYLGRITLHGNDIGLGDYGNQFPQITILADEATQTCDGIASWVCEQVKLAPDELDFSEIADAEFEGFGIESRGAAKSVLEQIGVYAQCDFPERDSGDGLKLTAWRRGRIATYEIADAELFSHDAGQALPDDKTRRVEEIKVPREVWIGALNSARKYTVDYGKAWREIDNASDEKAEIQLNFVCDKPKLNQLAEIELYRRVTERRGRDISVCPPHAWLATGDPVLLDSALGKRPYLLSESQEGLFGICTFKTVGYDAGIYGALQFGDDSSLPPTLVEGFEGFTYALFDMNSPTDEYNEVATAFFVATTPYNSDWETASISSSAFLLEGSDRHLNAERGTLGELVTALPPLPSWGGFDDTTQILVDMVYGELSSVTDEALLNGANACFLGNEGFQFGAALYVGEFGDRKRYRLTHLIRGRRGTEGFAAQGHSSGEAFALFNGRARRVQYQTQFINTPIDIGIQHPDRSIIEITKTLYGRNLKPYAPHMVVGARDGSNNLTVTWLRRSRYTSNWWKTGIDPIVGEANESYDVEALNGAGVVVRTWSGVALRQIEYSNAAQIADGLTGGDAPVRFKLYQLSAVVGRGYAADVTL